jgi:hypothetical protein
MIATSSGHPWKEITNLLIPQKARKLLIRWETISFSTMTLIRAGTISKR